MSTLEKQLIDIDEAWANAAYNDLKTFNDDQLDTWEALFAHCASNKSAKPSKLWLKKANVFKDALGENHLTKYLLKWFAQVVNKRITPMPKVDPDNDELFAGRPISDWLEAEDYTPLSLGELFITPHSSLILKGLIWLASTTPSSIEMTHALRNIAKAMYSKVPDFGMRNSRIANAAILSLSMMGQEGIKEIIILRTSIKYGPALKNINRVFEQLAKEKGITADELAQSFSVDYNISDVGAHYEFLGEFEAQLEITRVGHSLLTWKKGEKNQKSVPAFIRKTYPNEVKRLKALQKDLNLATSAHSQRIEQLYLRTHKLDLKTWKSEYIDHHLVGFLGRNIIWRLTSEKDIQDVIFFEGDFIDSLGGKVNLPKKASVTLWHPANSDMTNISQWRDLLVEKEIRQPFKQAHREIYLLTDAEKEAKTSSERFSGHVLSQYRFHALATQRAWSQLRGGGWDGGQETEASKGIRDHEMFVVFDTEGLPDYGQSAIYHCVGTRTVKFYKNKDIYEEKPLSLEKINPIVFSEIMRDIDLFVAVAGVANNADWEYRESSDYWQATAFGQLSKITQTRKEVLETLISKLKIKKQLSIKGNYLYVEGKLRTYKIHMGSSNILMEPNDRYLCIVAKHIKSKKADIFLPFDGDDHLSLILSKALLLASDNRIKDASILSQINET